MALGPGKYDDDLTAALAACRMRDSRVIGGMLIVIGPPGCNGFSCQLPLDALAKVPEILRFMAEQIEADLKKGKL